MKAISRKLLFLSMCLGVISLLAEEKKTTNIGQYFLKKAHMQASKVFVNDTSQYLLLTWQVSDPYSDRVFKKYPSIKPGDSYTLDLSEAVKALGSKSDKKGRQYPVDLFLGVVTKAPIMPYMDFEWRGLKLSEKGLRITQNEFLKNSTFRLYRAKSGKIKYKANA